ncbi:hypothetical protein IV73_GL000623 [Weissella kandleri]|uniref:Glycerol-3-phosphate dehydrogenase [NAD(P)+] n=1 Tax=Weissella kandleri TaxID=1616 RepID=A0A0R2JDL5_9LACO|nr:NAD(P)H-dependent glycerol-3-phosphate dehydrogenase [Weissella kandleri]KRN75456.1 hypothetical protein IV73_GL000623 [Weissella kandleri]
MKQTKIAVLGAGSWGTALANVAAENGNQIMLWAHRAVTVEEINSRHTNKQYLGDRVLQANIQATTDLKAAVDGAEIVLSVVPTKATREVAKQLNQALVELRQSVIIVAATKGLEPETYKFASQMIEEEVMPQNLTGLAVLAGPSHAEGVIKHDPTTVVAVSKQLSIAKQVQAAMSNATFRVYTNDDVVGAELGGALKNVIAIAAGTLQSLGYDANAKAALFTRGLNEMTQLGRSYGANAMTFMGLAGVGDLFATATSEHSRNFKAGMQFGQGKTMDEVIDNMGMVIEGISTTKVVHDLAQQKGVEMPISEAVYQVLYAQEDPKIAINNLMERPLQQEGK